MMFTSALAIVMLMAGCGLCCLHCRQRLSHYRQMAQGIRYLRQIEKILEHLPQHRGMANTFLNGDASFLEKMRGMQRTLEQEMGAVDRLHSSHGVHTDLLSRWQRIRSGWDSLKNGVQSLSAPESFERHSALIGEVLYLISDAADRMGLSSHPDPSARKTIQTAFNLLPPIIEDIGQARGIGSGAAARGTLLTAVRIKLEFLHQRLNETVRNAYSTIERSMQQGIRDNIAASQRQTEHFLATLSSQLLGGRITISASSYFNEGTAAFNSNLALLGAITAALEQQIDGAIPRLKARYLWSITLAVGGTATLALIWWNAAAI